MSVKEAQYVHTEKEEEEEENCSYVTFVPTNKLSNVRIRLFKANLILSSAVAHA